MKINEYLLVLAHSVLSLPPGERSHALETIMSENPDLDFQTLETPQKYSIGFQDEGEAPLSFGQWMGRHQEELKPRVLHIGVNEQGNLPAHIAAAFAGASTDLLEVGSHEGHSAYRLRVIFSRSSLLSASEFSEWIVAQSCAPQLSERVARLITEFHELNGLPPVSASELEEFLTSSTGENTFEHRASGLVDELQRTCKREGCSVVVPDRLSDRFFTQDLDEEERKSYARLGVSEYVPAKEELDIIDGRAIDYRDLIEAQSCAQEVWKRVLSEINQFIDPPFSAESLKDRLSDDSPHGMNMLPRGNVMRAIQLACRRAKQELRIPESLQGRVQLARRSRPSPESLRLVPNPIQFQVYLFTRLKGDFSAWPAPTDYVSARHAFVSALKKAEAFAKRLESPFFEAFKLARFVIETDSIPSAGSSQEQLVAWAENVDSREFSERARSILAAEVGLVNTLRKLAVPERRIQGLLAGSFADVFGGMGSWNDQGFESPQDQAEYNDVSAELYHRMTEFFAVNLNGG